MTDAVASRRKGPKPEPRWLRALKALRHRKMLAMMLLALAAGLPYGAVLGTLNAWLTAEGITPSQIGVLNFIILAYSFKLIWSPAFQKAWFPRIGIPFLERLGPRRSWMISLQLLIAVLLALLALSNPSEGVGYLALISVIIAVTSSVHDIVLEAWRIEVAESEEDKDLMSAVYQLGYRLAALFTGMIALILADHIPWQSVYLIIAFGMALAASGTLAAPEPDHRATQKDGHDTRPTYAAAFAPRTITTTVSVVMAGWAVAIGIIVVFFVQSLTQTPPPSTSVFTRVQAPIIIALLILLPGLIVTWLLRRNPAPAPHAEPRGGRLAKAADALFHTILDPLMDLVQRLRWAAILVLGLVLMYRFVDLIWGGFAYPFYLGDPSVGLTTNPAISQGALGHSNTDVAIASKTIGVFMTIAGSVLGGVALIFIGRLPALVIGALVAAVTNLIFADLALGGAGMDAFLAATGLAQAMSVFGDPALSRLIVAIAAENIAGGFASVAFVAYLTAMVNPKFAAVQYALLGSLVMLVGSLGRAELGTFIETNGYRDFFILTAWIGMIAVALSAAEWARQAMTKKSVAATQPAPQAAE
jgi:MFS transporter, PAT family, beta-lactamase induction signal transducer AmpG